MLKFLYNAGTQPSLYFWRDKNGSIEVDCLVARAGTLFPIEIKSTETVRSDIFNSLEKWHELTQTNAIHSYLVYAGELTQKRMHGHIVSWQRAGELIGTIEQRTLEK